MPPMTNNLKQSDDRFLADAIEKDNLTADDNARLEKIFNYSLKFDADTLISLSDKFESSVNPAAGSLSHLKRAILRNNFSILVRLIKHPFFSVDLCPNALIEVCRSSKETSVELVNQLIAVGIKVNFAVNVTKKNKYPTALAHAVFAKKEAIVDVLLNHSSSKSEYALYAAILTKQNNIIEKLLNKGATLHSDQVIAACGTGNVSFIMHAFEYGIVLSDEDTANAFEAALKAGNLAVIKFLLSKNYSLEHNTEEEEAAINVLLEQDALITACGKEDLLKAKSLLTDKNFAPEVLSSSLEEALAKKNLPLVKELIAKGANPQDFTKVTELELINQQKTQLLNIMNAIIGFKVISNLKYELLVELKSKIEAQKFTSVEDTKTAAKYFLTLALQRRWKGIFNTTTSGDNIKALFADDTYKELKTALFGSENVRYRDLRFFVTNKDRESKSNPKFLTAGSKENTYAFFTKQIAESNLDRIALDTFITPPQI